MDWKTWRSKKFVQSDREASFFMRFRDSLLESKTINSEIEEADSPPSQSYFERLLDSLLSAVESINIETGDRDSIFGGLRNSLLSALETIPEVDSPRSQLIFERLQLCLRFQYLDAELNRKQNYGSPPSQLRVVDRLPHPSQANKLYLYFWHSFGRIAYTLYEIQLPNPLHYPPTKATQDAEIRNPSPLRPIFELETGKYPEGMCCVQLSSGLYFFGGKFKSNKPYTGKDEKAKFMNGTRDVLPRDVYVFNFTLYNNCPHSLRRLNTDMLFEIKPMNYGKASPQAFVVCGKASEQIYVIGSNIDDDRCGYSAHFEVYDTSIDRWCILPIPPTCDFDNTFTWVGNAVVGSEAFFIGMQHEQRHVYCFNLGTEQWTKEVSVPDSPNLRIFSGKTEFLKNGFYGCYRNTVVKLAVTDFELREGTEYVFKEEEVEVEVEEEEEEEEGGEEEDGFYQVAISLCKYRRLRMVSKEKGMDAIYNVPRQLQSSTTLLHLGSGYFCYVRTGKPPQIHVDEVDDDEIPSNRNRFASIVIFQTAPRERHTNKISLYSSGHNSFILSIIHFIPSLERTFASKAATLLGLLNLLARIQHCFREVNRCADSLARMGADLDVDFISFDVLPDCILEQIRLDALGTLYCRRCTSSSSSL